MWEDREQVNPTTHVIREVFMQPSVKSVNMFILYLWGVWLCVVWFCDYLKNPGPLNILDGRLCQLQLSPSFCFIISVLECGSGYVFQDWHQMTPSSAPWVARTVNPPTWLATVALAFSLSWETSCYLSLFCPRLAWREERERRKAVGLYLERLFHLKNFKWKSSLGWMTHYLLTWNRRI